MVIKYGLSVYMFFAKKYIFSIPYSLFSLIYNTCFRTAKMDYNEEGVVTNIDPDLKDKVAGMGIRIGKKLKMLTRQPMKGPFVVMVDESTTSLGRGIAEKIIMEVKK